MDILIKGMEMPKGNDYLHLIIQGGKVHTAISCGHLTTDKLNVADAIEVKPHGRLIDADLMKEAFEATALIEASRDKGNEQIYFDRIKLVHGIIDRTPTVMEATE